MTTTPTLLAFGLAALSFVGSGGVSETDMGAAPQKVAVARQAPAPASSPHPVLHRTGIPSYLGSYDGIAPQVLSARQQRLAPAQGEVVPHVRHLPGYVDVVMDLAGNRLVLLWAQGDGANPGLAAARRVLDHSGTRYVVVRRQYSRAELDAGFARLIAAAQAGDVRVPTGPGVGMGGLSLEHDGLEVTIPAEANGGRVMSARHARAVARTLTEMVGVRVAVVPEGFILRPARVDRTATAHAGAPGDITGSLPATAAGRRS